MPSVAFCFLLQPEYILEGVRKHRIIRVTRSPIRLSVVYGIYGVLRAHVIWRRYLAPVRQIIVLRILQEAIVIVLIFVFERFTERSTGESKLFSTNLFYQIVKTKLKMPLGNHVALTPLEDMSAGLGQGGGGPPPNCQKVYVQRDYSEGTMVKFQTRFPVQLESRLDRQSFEHTVTQLNNYFAEAERASCSTYCEGCLACLTGYLIYICTETQYEKCLRKVAKFVSEQNDRVYKPRGLLLTDPTLRGLRLIEISILDRPAS